MLSLSNSQSDQNYVYPICGDIIQYLHVVFENLAPESGSAWLVANISD